MPTDPAATPDTRPIDPTPPTVQPTIPTPDGRTPPALPPPDRPPGPGARYQATRFHARGGLGEVYEAHDAELGRRVALKAIRPDRAGDPGDQARFLREAAVTARLEHPGVVPVHGLETDPDGRPVYAMRFVEGETLADAVRRFHGPDGPQTAAERGLQLRRLLARFVAVCQTVAYAHSRGVVHRDLKPQNVMLGPFGETLVVDWGLAKTTGGASSPADPAADTDDYDPSIQVPAGDGLTAAGAVLGTPAYMAPEQADGRPAGPAADVYALGAILAAVLTGRPPVEGTTVTDVLANVRRGEVVPPRRANPAIPRPLEAVCLKALAHDPAGRYPSAEALAADVERWLADEPVAAYREPPGEKARRWAKRHRTAVATAAAAAAVGLVGAVAGLAAVAGVNRELDKVNAGLESTNVELTDANRMLDAARREAEAGRDAATRARAAADAQRRDAERSAADARAAVERYFVAVSENRLLNEPGMAPLRRELLSAALDFYQKLAAEQRERPGDRAALAETLGRLARIQYDTAAFEAAAATAAQARDLADELDREAGGTPATAGRLAEAEYRLAACYSVLGRAAEASAVLKRAKAAAARMGGAADDAQARVLTAAFDFGVGETPERAGALADAVAALEEVVRRQPGLREHRYTLAMGCMSLAVSAHKRDRAEAERLYAQTLAHTRQLVREFPAKKEYTNLQLVCVGALGDLYRQTGRHADAVRYLTESVEYHEKAVRDDPDDGFNRLAAATMQGRLAVTHLEGGQPDAGGRHLARSLAHFERVLRDDPRNSVIADGLLKFADELTQGLWAGEAVRVASLVIDMLGPEATAAPKNRGLRAAAGRAYQARALARLVGGTYAEAIADLDRADGLAADPDQRWSLRVLRLVADAGAGRYAAAAAALDGLAADPPANAGRLRTLAWGYATAAAAAQSDAARPSADREADHRRYADRAAALLRLSLKYRARPDHAPLLRRLPAFTALRERPDVARVLDEIAAGADAAPAREVAPPPRPAGP